MAENIIKLTLSEQIYNILKEDILAGTIPLGAKLTNRELQERFQVSSTPIRDAINKLNQDGLIGEVTKTGAQLIIVESNIRPVIDALGDKDLENKALQAVREKMQFCRKKGDCHAKCTQRFPHLD